MSATSSAALVLAVMVAAFLVAKLLKVSTELSLFAAALAGALAGGRGLPARVIVEGAFTYFDIVLIFVTATLFMNLLKESGAAAFVVRAILRRFHRHKAPLFILLALLLLVPGALTGAGSVTVLIMGGLAATVLRTMDLPGPRIAAIIFIIAGLSAAAPPVNLWAMLTAAGVNMPYVGFFLPLLVPCVLLALATKDIYVSTGSACSEDSDEASHVLLAIGLKPEIARSCIRMSLGRFTTDKDIDTVLHELPGIVEKLRKISAFDPLP